VTGGHGGNVDGTSKGKPQENEAQFQNEEELTTVTVVEEFDPDELIHGPSNATISTSKDDYRTPAAKPKPKQLHKMSEEKTKRKTKVRYETKNARLLERAKQRARKAKKADLAGGKEERRNGTKRTRSGRQKAGVRKR
jgi:ribosomal RNA-processing protein 17